MNRKIKLFGDDLRKRWRSGQGISGSVSQMIFLFTRDVSKESALLSSRIQDTAGPLIVSAALLSFLALYLALRNAFDLQHLWLSVMVDEAVVVSASLLAIARVNNQRDNLLRLVKQGIMEQSDKQLRLEVLTELPSGKELFDYAHKRFSVGFGKSLRFEVTFAALGYYVSYVIISLLINFLNLRVGSSS